MRDDEKMSWGEVFTAGIIIGAAYYFAYHVLRYVVSHHLLG